MEELVLPGTLDALEPIREYVAKAATTAGLGRSDVYNLCLAVDEIATNVVVHGYEEAGLTGDLRIRAEREGDTLIIRLEDHGRPYDPNAHDLPTEAGLQLPLENRDIGGLGIFLATTAVKELQYTSGELGNVHRFVMLLPPNSQ